MGVKRERDELMFVLFEQLKDNKKWDIFMLQKENERIMKQVSNKTNFN